MKGKKIQGQKYNIFNSLVQKKKKNILSLEKKIENYANFRDKNKI